jgi:hypothetical protein
MWSAIYHYAKNNNVIDNRVSFDNLETPKGEKKETELPQMPSGNFTQQLDEESTMFTCNICNLQVLIKNKDRHLSTKRHKSHASRATSRESSQASAPQEKAVHAP